MRTNPAASVGSENGPPESGEDRGQDVGQQSETMERRYETQQHILAAGLQDRQGPHVRKQIAVRERHGLGRALGTRGEQDDRRGVERPAEAVHVATGLAERRWTTMSAPLPACGSPRTSSGIGIRFLRSGCRAGRSAPSRRSHSGCPAIYRMGHICGAGRPVQQYGQFAGQVQAEETTVGRYRAGKQHAEWLDCHRVPREVARVGHVAGLLRMRCTITRTLPRERSTL